jgi:hypothetical protein
MDMTTFNNAFEELDRLSHEEYDLSLMQILEEPVVGGSDPAVDRIGRLGGVLLKQPFAAKPVELTEPSPYTGALRAWPLLDESAFAAALEKDSWQAQTLKRIHAELAKENSDYQEFGVYYLAREAHSERGFFAYFAGSAKRYLCGDPTVRQKVQQALADAQGDGGTQIAGRLTPAAIVGTGGATLGVELVQAVPELGLVGAPMIAALVVIVYRIGLDGFCEWADRDTRDADGRVLGR